MEEGDYAANGIKHCIRPCDMTGKSAAIILRQIHPCATAEAIKYDYNIDLPQWLSSISLRDYNEKNKIIKYHNQVSLLSKKTIAKMDQKRKQICLV